MNFIVKLSVIAWIVTLMSCSNNPSASPKAEIPEIPEALQNENSSKIMYGRSKEDLVDVLYNELLEKDKDLKQLNDDIQTLNSKSDELTKAFENYKVKSDNYYNSASSKVAQMKDSALSKKLQAYINSSLHKYQNGNSGLEDLKKQISNNALSIHDRLLAMKILLTLPVIEQYQQSNRPESKAYKNLIQQQEELLKKQSKKMGMN